MKRAVRISGRASRDADQIYRWLSERSKAGAQAWAGVYLETLRKLPLISDNAPLIPEAEEFGKELREVLFKTRQGNPFRLVFLVDDSFIHVLFVRGLGQDYLGPEDLGP